jgi:hypothetical protein
MKLHSLPGAVLVTESSTIGRMVRAGIVLASRDAMPRVETAIGGAGALVMRADLGTAFDPECFTALERVLVEIDNDLARVA